MLVKEEAGKWFLWAPAALGELWRVKALLDKDPSKLNARDGKFKRTALMAAAANGHIDLVRFLVNRGAEVDLRDAHGYTALHMACGCGHAAVAALLLERGADPVVMDQIGWTPLMTASRDGHLAVVELLLFYMGSADVNASPISGRTALWEACERGHAEVVRALLYEGFADPLLCDRDGIAPIMAAWRNGHTETVEAVEEVMGRQSPCVCMARSPLRSFFVRVY